MTTSITADMRERFTTIMKTFVDEASNSATDPELFIPKSVDALIGAVSKSLFDE